MEQDIEKIQRICQLIYRVWKKEFNNNLRLTQLILNACPDKDITTLFYMTDEELEAKLREFYKDTRGC